MARRETVVRQIATLIQGFPSSSRSTGDEHYRVNVFVAHAVSEDGGSEVQGVHLRTVLLRRLFSDVEPDSIHFAMPNLVHLVFTIPIRHQTQNFY